MWVQEKGRGGPIWGFVCREWFGHSDQSGFRQKSKMPLQENPARPTLEAAAEHGEGEPGRDQRAPTSAPGEIQRQRGPWPSSGTGARTTEGLGLRACTRLGSCSPKSPPWLPDPTPGSGILPSEPTQGSRTPSQRCSPAVSVLEMDPGVGESPAKPEQGREVGQETTG